MTRDDMWKIFKNTGSIEAYITYSLACVYSGKNNDKYNENKRDNIKNKRHPKQG